MNVKKTVAIAATTGLLTALALPALADTEVYGSLRTSTAWTHTVVANGGGTNTNFDIGNDETSRLGVKYSAGNFFANIELGIGDPNVIDNAAGPVGSLGATGWLSSGGGLTTVYTRHAYGTYKFDVGTLLVGQTWDPYTVISEQHLNAEEGNCFFGALYDGRMPQVKFTLNNGLYIDIIRSQSYQTIGTQSANLGSIPSMLSSSNYQAFVIPKLAIGYDGKAGGATFGVGVLGQTFKDAFNRTENAGMLYAHSKYVAGPFDALVNASVGVNYDALGFLFEGGSYAAETGTHVQNVTTFTGLVGVGYKATDTVKFNAGIGGGSSSSKAASDGSHVVNLGGHVVTGPSWSFDSYVNAMVTLAKNVYVIPEYDFIDTQKSQANVVNGLNLPLNSNGARNHVFGAQWRFDF